MRLQELLSPLGAKVLLWPPEEMDPWVRSLDYDSRRVTEGSLFFAIQGGITDGHLYLKDAVRRGAVAVVSERQAVLSEVPWIQVTSIRPFMGMVADRFHGSPSRQLRLAGVTGTNGKTTTAFLLDSILGQTGPSLMMGTILTRLGKWEMDSQLTTPESVDLHSTLQKALEKGCTRGVVEISSHALAQYRIYPCQFPVAIFTNLSQDHLDYHGSLDEYFRTKCLLFDENYNPGLECAVLNADDLYAHRAPLSAHVRRLTFGFSDQADIYPLSHQTSLAGTEMELKFFERRLSLRSRLAGQYNLYNIMAAAAAASLMGVPDPEVQLGIEELGSVPGRFERIETPGPFEVIVDFAHTPHALENALALARTLTKGRLLCVFGCGGDRDRGKRSQMGAVASRAADLVIITSDNPRSEDPPEIASQVRAGIPSTADCQVILDRREAIAFALQMALPGDMVLIAGKGHETYQDIQGRKNPFDDRQVVKEIAWSS